MKPPDFSLSLATALILAAGVQPDNAAAATGPYPSAAIRPFALTDMSGWVELVADAGGQERRRPGSATSFESRYAVLEEILRVDTRGYSYHPRFLAWKAGIKLRAIEGLSNSGDDDYGRGARLLLGGDWRLSFLDEHAYGFSQHGKVERVEVNRSFARTYELDSEIYALSARWRSRPVSLLMNYTHRKRRGNGSGSDINERGDEFSFRLPWKRGTTRNGELHYQLTDRVVRGINESRQSLSATAYNSFGEAQTLRTNVRLNRQSDLSTRNNASVSAGLSWRHRQNLNGRYRLDFQHNDVGSQSTDNMNLALSLDHKLYDSLSSKPEFYARLEDASFGKHDTWGFRLSENYSKRLGRWGHLSLRVTPHAELARNRPTADTIQVFDESLFLSHDVAAELGHTNVDTSAIFITDSSGVTVYDEGDDYLVTVRGRITEITSIATGDIPDGSAVLVDYDYSPVATSDILTRSFSAGATLRLWKNLSLYTDFGDSRQTLERGDPGAELEDRKRYSTGIRWRGTWSSAAVEAAHDDSSFVSWDTLSQTLAVYTPPGSRWRSRLSTRHAEQVYNDSDEKIRRLSAALVVSGRLSQRTRGELKAEYRQERWRGGPSPGLNDSDSFGTRAKVTWRWRKLEVQAGLNLSRLSRDRGDEETADRVFIRARRKY